MPHDPHSDILQQSVESGGTKGIPSSRRNHDFSPKCAQTSAQEGGGAGRHLGGEMNQYL